MPTETTFPVQIFYSYSHKNEDFRSSMEKSLSLLRRQNLIREEWSDRKILPGQRISDAVRKEMKAADILVFLLSSDFISSESCMKEWKESKQFKSSFRIPIILTHCSWQDLLGDDDIKALPKDGRPISSYSDQSIAWNEIYEGIKSVVESIRSNSSPKKEFPSRMEEVAPDAAPPSQDKPTANRARNHLMSAKDNASAALAAKHRIEQGLEALRTGLNPYVEKHMRDRFGRNWIERASRARGSQADGKLDVHALLKTLLDNWSAIFCHDKRLRRARSFVSIAMDARNTAAHFAGEMNGRQALRYLDAMRELLAAAGAELQVHTVERLYEEQRGAEDSSVVPNAAPPSQGKPTADRAMRGKYAPLYRYLITRTSSHWRASFGEIETVLGFDLPASARRHPAWWANQDGGSHSHARAWREAGWRTRELNLKAETLVFERVGGVSNSL